MPLSLSDGRNGNPNDCEFANNIIPGNNCDLPTMNLHLDLRQYKGEKYWWNHWNGIEKGVLFIGSINENEIIVEQKIENQKFNLQDSRINYLFEKIINGRKHHCYLITQSNLINFISDYTNETFLQHMALILIDEDLKSTFILLGFSGLKALNGILSDKDKNLCVYDVICDFKKNLVKLHFFNWFNANFVTRFSFEFNIPSDSGFSKIIAEDLRGKVANLNSSGEIILEEYQYDLSNSFHLKTTVAIQRLDKIRINNNILIGPFLTNNNLLLPNTKEFCDDKTCEKIGTPEGYHRANYHDIIVKNGEKSCWTDKYNAKNKCSKLLLESISFSFGTPFIKLADGKLLGVGHIKMLTESNIYEYESEYVSKIQSNIKNYMNSLNGYKQHSLNCIIGYNYFSYFILFDETHKTFYISDFFLCANENNQYKFSLIFTTGIFKIGDDIYISSGDGDYYSNILVFNESVVLQNCKHDALSSSFSFEQMLFLLFYKRFAGNVDVINFDNLLIEDVAGLSKTSTVPVGGGLINTLPPSPPPLGGGEGGGGGEGLSIIGGGKQINTSPPKTCFGRLCSAISRRGSSNKRQIKTKKLRKRRKTRKFKHRNNSRSKQ